MSKDYILHNVDSKFYQEFKTACSHYGLSMREVFMRHMQNIVDDYNTALINKTFSAKERRKGKKK